jgi:glycosyltransferase involved in cell wall biosynthesis
MLGHKATSELLKSDRLRRIVAISTPIAQSLTQVADGQDISPKLIVATHGVLPETPKPKMVGPRARQRVVYAGNLHAGRGLSIIARLAHDFPSVDFLIVGGSREKFLLAGFERAPANLSFEEFIPPSEMSHLLSSEDILVAPYEREVYVGGRGLNHRTDAFMAPLKIFDYLGAQGVIIASDLPAIRSLLRDGRDSILLDPDDYLRWSSALHAVLSQAELRNRLRAGARETSLRLGTWSDRAARVLGDLT